ncbi:hypothetical protein Pan44_22450 [Caulifigura coniformis]|uniref:HEAT repeat protein n=1 Tax=Caulifigura coniformis TaxID=2527983 RepID=A0A517SDL7_9PLAN|nr:hypothetical protein [Caulifigura coniformis]QDT54218.1 hypothetical protein Pan44_22450 [Caulifigura coniformis]
MANRRRGSWQKTARAWRWAPALAIAIAGAQGMGSPSPSLDLSHATRRLGSTSFTDRHQAGDTLLRAGASAIPYLRQATESESPEVRFRAIEILQRIELQVLETQKADILSGALSDGQLPAWDRYLQIVDDSPAARRLFVAMLDRSPQLLLSFGTSEFAEQFNREVSEWSTSASPWPRRSGPEGAEKLAALLLSACQPECDPTPIQAQLISRPAEFSWFQNQVLAGERNATLKSILVAWIQQTGRGSADARLHLAQQYRYREGVVPAREIVAGAATALEIQSALLFLSSFGLEQDIPLVEQLLSNETELQTFQSQRPSDALKTQVRDVALVTLWRMRREHPAKHGMKSYLEQNGAPRPGTIGFQSDEERNLAILHWRVWRKRFVKTDLPLDGWAIEGRPG